jgi:hypothetical protein
MFSAVWTTITPGGAAGKRLPRLSRLPERLNPVTWQNNAGRPFICTAGGWGN